MNPVQSPASPILVARVLMPFGLGYFLSYLYRTVNVVIGPELADALGVEPAALGLLTSAYFIAFAAFQIPLGVLLDRYGPRRVESALLIVAAAGALVVARGDSTFVLALGRSLIGLGVSSCLMAAIKANVLWWPAGRLPLANGFILACGGLGAIAATAPVEAALAYTDWRGVFVLLALATLAMAALLFLAVPDASARMAGEGWGAALAEAGGIFLHPAFLRVMPLGALMQSSFLAYHGLWAGAWLHDVEGLGRSEIGTTLALATVGMILGTFGVGAAASALARRGIPVLDVVAASGAAYMLVQLGLVLRLPVPDAALWGAFIFFGSCGTLSYSVLSQVFPARLSGRVNTAYNMIVFVAAFLLQWLIGVLLGLWPATGGKVPIQAHVSLMAGLLGLEAAALLWLLMGRRKVSGAAPGAAPERPRARSDR